MGSPVCRVGGVGGGNVQSRGRAEIHLQVTQQLRLNSPLSFLQFHPMAFRHRIVNTGQHRRAGSGQSSQVPVTILEHAACSKHKKKGLLCILEAKEKP